MEIGDYCRRVGAWVEAHGGYFPPLANLARLTEETGELARTVGALFGPKVPKPGDPVPDPEEEVGDLFFVLAVLANQLDVDPERAAERALAKAAERDGDRFSA